MAKLQAFLWAKRFTLSSRKRKRKSYGSSAASSPAQPQLAFEETRQSIESLVPTTPQARPLGHFEQSTTRFHFSPPRSRLSNHPSATPSIYVISEVGDESMAATDVIMPVREEQCCHGALNIEAKRCSAIPENSVDTSTHRQSRRASLFAPFKRSSMAVESSQFANEDALLTTSSTSSTQYGRRRSDAGIPQTERNAKRMSALNALTGGRGSDSEHSGSGSISPGKTKTNRNSVQMALHPLDAISEKKAEKKERRKTMDQQLLAAAAEGDSASVGLLISAGTKPYKADSESGAYPVHHAAAGGHVATLKGLVEFGAGIDVKNKAGRTPLHVAVLNGKVEMVQYLVHAGAKLEEKDKWGYTALHLAASAETDTKTTAESEPNRHSSRKSWVRPNSTFQPFEFDTAGMARQRRISVSAASPNVAPEDTCLEALVRASADLEAANDRGETPLHLAVRSGNAGSVRRLLDGGANLTALNDDGLTPMSVLMSSTMVGADAEVSKLLIERGNMFRGSIDEEEKEEVMHSKL